MQLFVAPLALNAKTGFGQGFETLPGDLAVALFARSELADLDFVERMLNFIQLTVEVRTESDGLFILEGLGRLVG